MSLKSNSKHGAAEILRRHVAPGEEFDALRYACAVGRSLSVEAWLLDAFKHGSGNPEIRRRVTCPGRVAVVGPCHDPESAGGMRRALAALEGSKAVKAVEVVAAKVTASHENNLCLNGEGLAGVERDALMLAFKESNGVKAAAARRLKITRATFQSKWDRAVKPLLAVTALCLVALLASGCFTSTAGRIVPPMPPKASGQAAESQSVAMAAMPAMMAAPAMVASVPQPKGHSIGLAWDASPSPGVTGYTVLCSSNKTEWRAVAMTADTAANVGGFYLPQWFVVTAHNADGTESDYSNMIGWLGMDTVVSVHWEHSPDLQAWTSGGELFRGTNPPGMKFFRTRAETETRAKFE